MYENLPYSNFHDLNTDWIIKTIKTLEADWNTYNGTWEEWKNDITQRFNDLNSYVMNYFANLDVQDEINNKLEEMFTDGRLDELLGLFVPYVTPEMFGAVGDGVNDDSQAFTDALNMTMPVVLTKGKTYLASNITLNTNAEIIGNHARILNTTNDYTFVVDGNTIIIDDVQIDGAYGIDISSENTTSGIKIRDCYILNANIGIRKNNFGGYNKIENCYIRTLDDGIGILIGNDVTTQLITDYFYISKTSIEPVTKTITNNTGIKANNVLYLYIDHCDIVNFKDGVLLDDSFGTTANYVYITNTSFFQCTNGVHCNNQNQNFNLLNVVNCSFTRNHNMIYTEDTTKLYIVELVNLNGISSDQITLNKCNYAYVTGKVNNPTTFIRNYVNSIIANRAVFETLRTLTETTNEITVSLNSLLEPASRFPMLHVLSGTASIASSQVSQNVITTTLNNSAGAIVYLKY